MIRQLVLVLTMALTAAPALAQWSYAKVPDEMRKTTSLRARLISSNAHEFSFPYNGGSRLSIAVWFHPFKPETDDRHDISLFLSKGQFSCHTNDVCSVYFKIDDGEVEPFSGELSDDSGLMWLTGGGQVRLLDAIAKNKRIIIEVPVFHRGDLQYQFKLQPLPPM